MKKRIDAHMHISQWFLPNGQTSFEVLEQYQKDNHIEHVANMCCTNNANLWNGYELDQCMIAAVCKFLNPSAYIYGCLVIPDTSADVKIPDEIRFENQAAHLMEIGFDGIKCCDFKPDAFKLYEVEKRLDDYEKYFAYCEKYNIPMCWHVSDPQTFWDASQVPQWAKQANWFYGHPSYPTYEHLYELTYGFLDRHPKLRVMLAHAFFLSENPKEVITLFEKYPNVTLDLAPGWEMFDGFRKHYDAWYHIFRQYSDRILYATDATMSTGLAYVDSLAQNVYRFLTTADTFEVPGNYVAHGIQLEDAHLDRILCNNFKRIAGDSPKELHLGALKRYFDTYLPFMPDSQNKQQLANFYRKNLL